MSLDDQAAICDWSRARHRARDCFGVAHAGADVAVAARTVSELEEVAGEIRALGRARAGLCQRRSPARRGGRPHCACRRDLWPARYPGQQRRRQSDPALLEITEESGTGSLTSMPRECYGDSSRRAGHDPAKAEARLSTSPHLQARAPAGVRDLCGK